MTEFKDFKDALVAWTDRPTPPPAPPPEKVAPPYTPGKRQERVENGEILRTPVDRVAARVVAPAPWYFQAPDIKPNPEPEKPKVSKTTTINTTAEEVLGDNFIPGGPREGALKTKIIGGEEYIDIDDLAVRVINEINKHPQRLTPLARAALDARTVLDESLSHVGLSMDGFKDGVTKWLQEFRTARMNFASEANYMLGPLKDIRQFFLESTYEKEIARLREFVELCERLQKLKESGFLDTVADTMIRLATKSENQG